MVVGKAKVVVLEIAVPLLAGSVTVVMPAVVVGTAKVLVKTDELEIAGQLAPTKEEVTVEAVGPPRDVVLFPMNTKEEDLAISLVLLRRSLIRHTYGEAAVDVETPATDENTTVVTLLGLENVTVVLVGGGSAIIRKLRPRFRTTYGAALATDDDTTVSTGKNTEATGELKTSRFSRQKCSSSFAY